MQNKFTRTSVGALLIGHCAGMIDLISLPVWIGVLVGSLGYSPQVAGQTVTLFLLAVVVASVVTARLFENLPRRPVAAVGFAVAGVCFFLAGMRSDIVALSLLHLLAGAGVGMGLSLVHGAMGRSDNPHRIFGFAGVALGGAGTVFLAIVPQVIQHTSGPIIFTIFSGIMLVAALATLLAYPTLAPRVRTVEALRQAPLTAPVWFAIIGVSLMTLNNAVVFAFFDVIGKIRGFEPSAINTVFIVLGLLNFLVVAPAAVVLQKRVRAERVVLVGPLFQLVLAIVITNAGSYLPWAAAAALYTGVQISTHTFAFGLLAKLDDSGRAVAATPAMLMLGAALGPLLGGAIGQVYGFGSLGFLALAIGAGAFGCFWRSVSGAQLRALPV